MKLFIFLFLFFSLIGCRSVTVLMPQGEENTFRSLQQYIDESPALQTYFLGVQLYDLGAKEVVFSKNESHFFTPASVTKWLTLYSATQSLSDSIAFMNVYKQNGKTIFQPLGDPSFLHPDVQTEPQILDFFENQTVDTIYWSDQHFQDQRFGSGWAWDDYEYYFQPEKSVFPIQSNLLRFEKDSVSPTFIASEIYFNFSENQPTRTWDENRFFVDRSDRVRYIPFRVDSLVLKNYFVEKHKRVVPVSEALLPENLVKTFYSKPSDSLYQLLMQNSDNHIAEQLLLQVSQQQLGFMNTEAAITHAKENWYSDIAEDLLWVDGSGLSRYNMVTPAAIVQVINNTVSEQKMDWLQEILPAGGQSGTLKNNYAFSPPRVYAKTGTLRHNHNLAGIVQAKSGKWYSFCIMNNHIPGSSSIAKAEMENLLQLIVELY